MSSLTTREQNAIGSLRSAGVSVKTIADSFGITTNKVYHASRANTPSTTSVKLSSVKPAAVAAPAPAATPAVKRRGRLRKNPIV